MPRSPGKGSDSYLWLRPRPLLPKGDKRLKETPRPRPSSMSDRGQGPVLPLPSKGDKRQVVAGEATDPSFRPSPRANPYSLKRRRGSRGDRDPCFRLP